MSRRPPTAEEVRRANLEHFNRVEPEEYDRIESIFEPDRQDAVRARLAAMAAGRERPALLDLGCGTGNVLRLAEGLFARRVGCDIGYKLLAKVAAGMPGAGLVGCDGERLPFADGSFDAVSCYAVLHHFVDPLPMLVEARRVLRPGGMLYTDHDPNRYLGRFYRPYYVLRYRFRPGFGDDVTETAEYHNAWTAGLDPEALAEGLRAAGYREVEVVYRNTRNKSLPLPFRAALAVLRGASRVWPAPSFFTHFSLRAIA